jgi:hypothetical protein
LANYAKGKQLKNNFGPSREKIMTEEEERELMELMDD